MEFVLPTDFETSSVDPRMKINLLKYGNHPVIRTFFSKISAPKLLAHMCFAVWFVFWKDHQIVRLKS